MSVGLIFDIKHFAVHDGDGIRTTVFFSGCPLRCVWCHNPEGLEKSYSFVKSKCVMCGECAAVCLNDVHVFKNGEHAVLRDKCVFCRKCEKVCLGGAIRIYGKKMTAKSVFEEIAADKPFYSSSGGGVTLSGGECLCQPDFCAELLKKCKESGINTAVDTCGYVRKQTLDKVIPFTDTFLYDIKAFNEETHIRATGVSNRLIFENIKYLDEYGCRIEVRIPLVPEYNPDEIEDIGRFLKKLKNIAAVRVLPYHGFIESKYEAIGKTNPKLPAKAPTKEQVERAKETLKSFGLNCR